MTKSTEQAHDNISHKLDLFRLTNRHDNDECCTAPYTHINIDNVSKIYLNENFNWSSPELTII